MSFLFQNVTVMSSFRKIGVYLLWGFVRAPTSEKQDPQFPEKPLLVKCRDFPWFIQSKALGIVKSQV